LRSQRREEHVGLARQDQLDFEPAPGQPRHLAQGAVGGKKQAQIIATCRARLRSRLKASLIVLFRPGPARRISPPANVTVLCQAALRRRENGCA
jgi:hypothetical protein